MLWNSQGDETLRNGPNKHLVYADNSGADSPLKPEKSVQCFTESCAVMGQWEAEI